MEEGSDGPAEANYEDELSELDRIVESYADAENARDPTDFNGTQGPGTQAPSPADLFRLMESSERRSKPSTEAPGAPGAPGNQGSLEHLGVSETVREHSQVESGASSQGAPRRVSKFKADRQEGAQKPLQRLKASLMGGGGLGV